MNFGREKEETDRRQIAEKTYYQCDGFLMRQPQLNRHDVRSMATWCIGWEGAH